MHGGRMSSSAAMTAWGRIFGNMAVRDKLVHKPILAPGKVKAGLFLRPVTIPPSLHPVSGRDSGKERSCADNSGNDSRRGLQRRDAPGLSIHLHLPGILIH